MSDELSELYDHLEKVKGYHKELILEKVRLENTSDVQRYLDVLEREKSTKKIYDEALIAYEEATIMNCHHIFLRLDSNDPCFCCLKCGLSNINKPKIFSLTYRNGMLLNFVHNNLNYVKILYDRIKDRYSDYSEWALATILENEISSVNNQINKVK